MQAETEFIRESMNVYEKAVRNHDPSFCIKFYGNAVQWALVVLERDDELYTLAPKVNQLWQTLRTAPSSIARQEAQRELVRVLDSYRSVIYEAIHEDEEQEDRQKHTFSGKPSSGFIALQNRPGRYEVLFPRHAHKEQSDDFIEKYIKTYPDKATTYKDLLKEMAERKQQQETAIKARVEKAYAELQDDAAQKESKTVAKAREEQQKAEQEVTKVKESAKQANKEKLEIVQRFIAQKKEQANLEGLNWGGGTIARMLKEELGIKLTRRRINQILEKMQEEAHLEAKGTVVVEDGPVPKGPLE